ncbi:MAG: TIGR04086 family membrane protein [Sedimentibacter sp.]
MNFVRLLKYSLYLIVLTLVVFFILTIYMYYFSRQPSLEFAYNFVVPISMFIVALMYSKSVHEKGLLRGIEIWIVYFALVLLVKVLFQLTNEISIVKHLLYLPASILGGVIGVNLKHRFAQR